MYKVEKDGENFSIVYIEYGEREVISETLTEESAQTWCDKLNDAFSRGCVSDR